MKFFFTLLALFLSSDQAERRREEWWSDYTYAPEMGIPRFHIVLGAVMTVFSSFGYSAELSPETRVVYHLRMAFAIIATFYALSAGVYLLEDFGSNFSLLLLWGGATLAVAATVFHLLSGLAAKTEQNHPTIIYAGTALATVLTLALGMVSGVLLALTVTTLFALCGILAAFTLASMTPLQEKAGGQHRTLRWALFLYLATGTLMLVHIFVLNPLTAVPGISLPTIYKRLMSDSAGFGAASSFAMMVVSSLVLVLVPALLALWLGKKYLRSSRKAQALLLMAPCTAAIATTMTFGFAMGMSLADVYSISGSDAAPLGAIARRLFAIPALLGLFLFLAPRRPVL